MCDKEIMGVRTGMSCSAHGFRSHAGHVRQRAVVLLHNSHLISMTVCSGNFDDSVKALSYEHTVIKIHYSGIVQSCKRTTLSSKFKALKCSGITQRFTLDFDDSVLRHCSESK